MHRRTICRDTRVFRIRASSISVHSASYDLLLIPKALGAACPVFCPRGLRPANIIVEGICGREERLSSSLHVICQSFISRLRSALRRVRACLLAWRIAHASNETNQHIRSWHEGTLEHSYYGASMCIPV